MERGGELRYPELFIRHGTNDNSVQLSVICSVLALNTVIDSN